MKINAKIVKLFTNKGFYILLALGIGILGASGYVGNLKSKKDYDLPASAVATVQPPRLSDVPAMSSVEVITPAPKAAPVLSEIGRASCRERV